MESKKITKQFRVGKDSQFAIGNNLAVHILEKYKKEMVDVFESIKLNGNGGKIRRSSQNLLYAKIIELEKSMRLLKL